MNEQKYPLTSPFAFMMYGFSIWWKGMLFMKDTGAGWFLSCPSQALVGNHALFPYQCELCLLYTMVCLSILRLRKWAWTRHPCFSLFKLPQNSTMKPLCFDFLIVARRKKMQKEQQDCKQQLIRQALCVQESHATTALLNTGSKTSPSIHIQRAEWWLLCRH